MSSIASSLSSSGKRTKAEELALRRAQLERRASRQREQQQQQQQQQPQPPPPAPPQSAGTAASAEVLPVARTASYEEAERAAREEARAERAAKDQAERRANDMALRALEAERTKRIEAEKLLDLERAHSAELLSKIKGRDRRKFERTQAAITIQARWRGYWIRESLLGGKEEMERRATTLQSHFRGFKVRSRPPPVCSRALAATGCACSGENIVAATACRRPGAEGPARKEAKDFGAAAAGRVLTRAARAEADRKSPGMRMLPHRARALASAPVQLG
jgi:hypothetical protein